MSTILLIVLVLLFSELCRRGRTAGVGVITQAAA